MYRCCYLFVSLLLLLPFACDNNTPTDSEFSDSDSLSDSEFEATVERDTGTDISETNQETKTEINETEVQPDLDNEVRPDAANAAPGFGEISGDCRVLDTELTADDGYYFENHLDFSENPYDESDRETLTEGGREILSDGNAGGSSILSEVFAFEVLNRCESAVLVKTETEITYQTEEGPKTDFLVKIDNHKVAASVTRAMSYPHDSPYPTQKASSLLKEKLADIEKTNNDVSPTDRWTRHILSVMALDDRHEESIHEAYRTLSKSLKDNAIVFVTVTDGEDTFLY